MEEEKTFNQILEELKNLREEKDISLEQIAEQTKINLKFLKDLEAGQWQNLPKIYDRYIFKTYLKKIKAQNTQELLNLFDRQTGRLPGKSTVMKQRKAQTRSERKLVFGFTVLKLIYIVIPLLIIILLLVIFFQNYNPQEKSGNKTVRELTAMDILKASSPKDIVALSAEKNQKDSLNLNIVARERCWLRYIKDHADTNEVTLSPRTPLNISADSVLEMRIGNPAGITLQMANQTFDSLAAPGQVISYLKITQSGIVTKRIVKPKKKVVKNEVAPEQ